MLSLRKLLLYGCVLLASGTELWAQQYSFINYSIEDGLAQSQVQTIFQDDKGYMWMGTYGGLSRYDGNSFVNYSKADGLLDNRINYIAEGPDAELYFATLGGVNRYDGTKFSAITLKTELSKNQVTAIALDKQGNLWMGTDGAGVCRYDGKSIIYYNEQDGLINNYVRSVCMDKNGTIWFGTRGGLCSFDGKGFRRIDPAITQPHNVSQIIRDKNENLWICTYGEGIYRYDFNSFVNYNEKNGLIMDWIRSATQDTDGNFWFASKNGVSKFDGEIFLNFNKSNGLFYPNINTVVQDKEGKVWFGTDGKGVMKFTGETFVNYTTQDGLSSDIIMSVAEDKQNNRWYCTYGNGVCKEDATTHTFTNYTSDDGLNNNVVWTSYADENSIWFGTSDGVCQYDGKKFTPYTDSLPAKTVYSIFRDSKGTLWFGTTAGVARYDGETSKNFTYGRDAIGRNIRSIAEDAQHNIWFASSSGVYRYDGTRFTNFTTADGLADNNVVSLTQDQWHNLWIGTSNGISVYDGKQFTTISVDEKYSANNVNFLLFDSASHLWVGTNNGIYELDAQTYHDTQSTEFRHYTNFEGLRSLECNQNAAFEDHSGNMWFGTSEGILRYAPLQNGVVAEAPEPLTHITGVRLFLQPTDWSTYADSVNPADGLPMNLHLDYKKTYLTFDYIGISLSNPAAVRYKFKLEGFDSDWSPATTATFATYANLPHGKYTFMVKACNKDNVWNEVPATFSFEIRPPFWLTWWFSALSVVFIVGMIYAVYRWRLTAIRRKHHTQQLEYKSRLLVLEHQTLNASMNRHFVFNALNSIQYYITKENKMLATKYLSSFAKLIRKNLDSSMSDFVPLEEEMERLRLYLELEDMRLENKFEYRIDMEGDLDTESIEIPPMMLQPYIENSIWHGILPLEKKGMIVIAVKEVGDDILFSIEDNGIGVEASKARKSASGQLHISRGMEITNGRINLLRKMTNSEMAVKGPFDLKNEKGETIGTRVEILLPIKVYS